MKWACGVWTYFQKMFFSNMIFVMMIPCITKMRITFVHRTCQEGNGTMKLLIRRHDKWITSYSNRTSHTSSHNLRRDRPTCWNLSPSPCSSKFEAANVQLEHCFYELFSKTVFEKKPDQTGPIGIHVVSGFLTFWNNKSSCHRANWAQSRKSFHVSIGNK